MHILCRLGAGSHGFRPRCHRLRDLWGVVVQNLQIWNRRPGWHSILHHCKERNKNKTLNIKWLKSIKGLSKSSNLNLPPINLYKCLSKVSQQRETRKWNHSGSRYQTSCRASLLYFKFLLLFSVYFIFIVCQTWSGGGRGGLRRVESCAQDTINIVAQSLLLNFHSTTSLFLKQWNV